MKVTKRTIASILLSVGLIFGSADAVAKEKGTSGKKATPIEKNIKMSEVKVLAKYIQSRNSKIPSELAYMESMYIITLSNKHDISVALVNGIIEKESTYNPLAVSKERAKGLMQVLVCDGVDIDKRRIHDIGVNIDTGIKILKKKIESADGNIHKGLNRYSGGAKKYSKGVYGNIRRYKDFRNKEENKPIVALN